MAAVSRGEAQAVRLMVDRYLPGLTRFAYRMLADAQEAQDVAQECFVRLWRTSGSWEARAKVRTWLYRVAHNMCIDRLRARREMVAPPRETEDVAEAVPERIARCEQNEALSRAMAALPERQRAAIGLVYYEEMSNREAAEVLGLHEDALESLLARGRRNLKAILAGERPQGA